jgi:hypothetical protein
MLEDVLLRLALPSWAAIVRTGQTDVVTDDARISVLATYVGSLRAHTNQGHPVVSALGRGRPDPLEGWM